MIMDLLVNMMEDGKKNDKGKRKKKDDRHKGSNKKPKLVCWNYNEPGHLKHDCGLRKNKNCAST